MEQNDLKVKIEKARADFDNVLNYAHALKRAIDFNDNYCSLFSLSLLILVLRIANGEWNTKAHIKKDFKNYVRNLVENSKIDSAKLDEFSRQLSFAVLQLASEYPLVGGVTLNFKDVSTDRSDLNLNIKASKLCVYENGREFIESCFGGLEEFSNEVVERSKVATRTVFKDFCEQLEKTADEQISMLEEYYETTKNNYSEI